MRGVRGAEADDAHVGRAGEKAPAEQAGFERPYFPPRAGDQFELEGVGRFLHGFESSAQGEGLRPARPWAGGGYSVFLTG